jgi:hypothetical protein
MHRREHAAKPDGMERHRKNITQGNAHSANADALYMGHFFHGIFLAFAFFSYSNARNYPPQAPWGDVFSKYPLIYYLLSNCQGLIFHRCILLHA